MTMKRLIAATIIVASALSAIAQQKSKVSSRSYVRAGMGYALAHAGNTAMAQMPVGHQSTSLNVTRVAYKRGSFGQGFYATFAWGRWLSNHFGAELGVHVGIRGKRFDYGSENNERIALTSYSKMPVYLMPSAVLQTGGHVNVFARVGLAMNVLGAVVEDGTWTSFQGGTATVEQTRTVYKFRTGIGFQGALGFEMPLSKHANIYLEANGISMNQYLKNSTLTRYSVNEVDQLNQVPEYYKKTKYEMSFSEDLPVRDEPRQAAAYALPFSNFGAAAGVIVRF